MRHGESAREDAYTYHFYRDTPDSELANPEQPNSELFLGLIQNSPIQNRPFQNWQIQNCLFQNSFRIGLYSDSMKCPDSELDKIGSNKGK